MAINYTGVDLDRYNQGDRFLSQDRFLANYNPRDAITFNESPNMNTGIISAYNPFPFIPQGGDGGDGSIGIDTGEITSDVGFGNLDDQTDMGYTLTEEDKAAIASQKNKNRLSQAAQLGLFALNPLGFTLRQIAKPYTDPFVDKIKDKLTGGGGDGPGPDINPGTFTAQSLSDSFSGEEGPSGGGGGNMSASDFSDDTAGTPFEYGGRVGYSNGGLSKYEIFKLGELGYNTKGGTVLAPFGGIKVLRDILKVNNYAGGGIVGLYR